MAAEVEQAEIRQEGQKQSQVKNAHWYSRYVSEIASDVTPPEKRTIPQKIGDVVSAARERIIAIQDPRKERQVLFNLRATIVSHVDIDKLVATLIDDIVDPTNAIFKPDKAKQLLAEISDHDHEENLTPTSNPKQGINKCRKILAAAAHADCMTDKDIEKERRDNIDENLAYMDSNEVLEKLRPPRSERFFDILAGWSDHVTDKNDANDVAILEHSLAFLREIERLAEEFPEYKVYLYRAALNKTPAIQRKGIKINISGKYNSSVVKMSFKMPDNNVYDYNLDQ